MVSRGIGTGARGPGGGVRPGSGSGAGERAPKPIGGGPPSRAAGLPRLGVAGPVCTGPRNADARLPGADVVGGRQEIGGSGREGDRDEVGSGSRREGSGGEFRRGPVLATGSGISARGLVMSSRSSSSPVSAMPSRARVCSSAFS